MKGPGGEARRRQDRLTGRWCVVAPERGLRPVEWAGDGDPAGSSACPFCPGHEDELGPILAEDRGESRESGAAWRTRAVANRYPAFRSAGEAQGHQEVLIESPVHGWDWAGADPADARAALDLYLDRMAAAARERPGHRVFAFRNRGRDAGSSRAHPHGQLVAVRGVPPEVARLERRQRLHHRRRGGCLLCGLPADEPRAAERTVVETPHHRVVTLWAPADPFHLRVVPRRHVTTFSEFGPDERDDLAGLLPRVLAALRRAAGDPAYNLLFREGPGPARPGIHAHLEVRPRFGRIAGFELLTEVALVPSDPVDDARALRDALPNPHPAPNP